MATEIFENGHALVIGVGDDLPVTVNDATAINNVLADPAMSGYDPKNITLLVNEAADRNGILKGFDDLIAKTDEESTVFIFYSGHGGYYKPWDQYYLVPNGFKPDDHESTWLSAQEFQEKLNGLQSKKTILFLDCCHAQGMTKSKRAPVISEEAAEEENDPKTSLEKADELAGKFDDVSGLSYVSSCRSNQKSYILGGDNNSLFTKCLVEVLQGKHKTTFDDPYVRMTEALQYLWREVPKRCKEPQMPTVKIEMDADLILSLAPQTLRKSPTPIKVETDDFLIEMSKEELGQLKELFKTQSDLVNQLRKEKMKFIDGTSIFKTELQILDAQMERQELMKKIKNLMAQVGGG